jgi:hypothetical protein
MAVLFDNALLLQTAASTNSFTSSAFTISGSANRAAMVHIILQDTGVTISSVSIGGVAGAAIAGAACVETNGVTVLIWGVKAPPSGSQTCTITTSIAATFIFGIIACTGVDQTTAFNNGTGDVIADADAPLSVTSNTGDLTSTCVYNQSANTISTDRTAKWGATVESDFRGGDIGPGTGTTVHTWSDGVFNNKLLAGANFIAASGTAASPFEGPFARLLGGKL